MKNPERSKEMEKVNIYFVLFVEISIEKTMLEMNWKTMNSDDIFQFLIYTLNSNNNHFVKNSLLFTIILYL